MPIGQRGSRATRACRPEALSTSELPPLPLHIRRQEAQKMMKALVKGDEGHVGTMEKALRGELEELEESVRS
jgi:hypothetical protein